MPSLIWHLFQESDPLYKYKSGVFDKGDMQNVHSVIDNHCKQV